MAQVRVFRSRRPDFTKCQSDTSSGFNRAEISPGVANGQLSTTLPTTGTRSVAVIENPDRSSDSAEPTYAERGSPRTWNANMMSPMAKRSPLTSADPVTTGPERIDCPTIMRIDAAAQIA